MRTRQRPFEYTGDAIALVRSQHREIDSLLEALTSPCAAPQKAALVAEMGDLLAVHLALEERVFHPGLIDQPSDRIVVVAVEDHFETKRLLARLLETDVEDPGFDVRARLLLAHVRAHVESEERQVLRGLRARIPATRLRRLAYQMRVLEFQLRIDTNPRRTVLADAASPVSA